MKAIILTVTWATALGAGVSTSLGGPVAPGAVNFFNNTGTRIQINNGTTTFNMYGSAGTYDLGLYMGPAGSTDLSQMQLVDIQGSPNVAASTSFNAGVFSAGTVVTPGNVPNTLNFRGGLPYAFLVAGWTAADGSSVDQVLASGNPNAYLGISELGSVIPNNFPFSVPNLFGTDPGQIGGFLILPIAYIPEPAALALAGLGGAALLLFRRRK